MSAPTVSLQKPTRVRYGVLGFACALAMITYLDRVSFGTVAGHVQSEFGLSETQKGLLFTAFAFAYALFEVPTGWLGDKFGARKTLIRIVLWWSVFTALTGSIYPTLGLGVAYAVMLAVRFLFGVGEAGAYPNIARAFHSWFPFEERGFAKGTVWMASRFAGGITAFIVYALIYDTVVPSASPRHEELSQHLLLGAVGIGAGQPWASVTSVVATQATLVETHWRHVFYVFGTMGLVWCALWWWWYRDRPEDKAGVNSAELDLIRGGDPHDDKPLVVPWRKLFSNVNLWMLCGMYFCAAYGWYINITFFPQLLKELGIEPGSEKWTLQFWNAGLMAGMPLLVGSVACLIGGYLTDLFIKRTGNRKWGRRLFGVVGHCLCAACYFAALFFMKSPWAFVGCIAMAAFWNDMTMGSAWASCLDIGKRYSGIVAGCMNTVGNLGGEAAGVLTGQILDWHTGSLSPGSDAFRLAKDQGWVVNISIFGTAYVIAALFWLRFDATKPVVASSPVTEPDPDVANEVVGIRKGAVPAS